MENGLWRCADVDERRVAYIAQKFGLTERRARWLCSRIASDEEIRFWLNPLLTEYTDPFGFCDMGEAVRLVREAVRLGKRIAVVGDYDVDGVTSSAILGTALGSIGANWECLIPHRILDGYGLSLSLVDRARESGCEVIVTVDNGIRAVEAVEHAKKCGMSVVVTDHHEPSDNLPLSADAIVHYIRSGNPQAQKLLSGAGVAWKLALALTGKSLDGEVADWLRGLAALGALADVMPMRGENRRLVVEGMEGLRRNQRPGWLTLCNQAGVDPKRLTETDILFSLTPRLNAAGRMDNANVAFRLLTSTLVGSAVSFAEELERLNTLRKAETERATVEAAAQVGSFEEGDVLPPVIVVKGEWPLGVVGIVAAKLVERYNRPAIVFADGGEDLLRGSGRSPEDMPLYSSLEACAECLEHYGGHETALGCGVLRHRFDEFRGKLGSTMAAFVQTNDYAASQIIADDYLPLTEATADTARWLCRLGPYGNGFPAFQFYIGPVEVSDVAEMGAGRHLRLTVREGKSTAAAVWFNPPKWAFSIETSSLIACVVSLELNTWQGRERVQLRVIHASVLSTPLTREDFAEVYRILQKRRQIQAKEVLRHLPAWNESRLQTVFDTFVDLGFAYVEQSAYHVVEQAQSCDLRESRVYQQHLQGASERRSTAG